MAVTTSYCPFYCWNHSCLSLHFQHHQCSWQERQPLLNGVGWLLLGSEGEAPRPGWCLGTAQLLWGDRALGRMVAPALLLRCCEPGFIPWKMEMVKEAETHNFSLLFQTCPQGSEFSLLPLSETVRERETKACRKGKRKKPIHWEEPLEDETYKGPKSCIQIWFQEY